MISLYIQVHMYLNSLCFSSKHHHSGFQIKQQDVDLSQGRTLKLCDNLIN